MKSLVVLVAALLSINASAADFFKFVKRYSCEPQTYRTRSLPLTPQGRLEMNLAVNEQGRYRLTQVAGHVQLNDEDNTSSYYAIFAHMDQLLDKPNYKSRVYVNHAAFELNAVGWSSYDGGGMWGTFLIEKSGADQVKAHYVLKAGDHTGGTLDFNCKYRQY